MNGDTDDNGAYLKRMRRSRAASPRCSIKEDEYFIDLLAQVSAATKALEAVALGLVDEHHCVTHPAAEV
jgi:DNA-binding FrmR family transcriptional regulator